MTEYDGFFLDMKDLLAVSYHTQLYRVTFFPSGGFKGYQVLLYVPNAMNLLGNFLRQYVS